MIQLENAIIEGLQMLLTLRLPGAPAEDTIEAVGEVWIRACLHGRRLRWAPEDADRLRQAFLAVAAHCDRWPTPNQVLGHLPPRPDRPRLAGPARPLPDAIRAQFKALLARLLVNDRPRPPTPNEQDWPALEARLAEQRAAQDQPPPPPEHRHV